MTSNDLIEAAFERKTVLHNLDTEETGRWARMALVLFASKEAKDYRIDGCKSFGEWLVHEGFSFSETHANTLIGAYRTLVVEHDVDFDDFAELDVTKVREVLPAIRSKFVSVAQAVADIKVLPRAELRARYVNPNKTIRAEDEPEWCVCACGNRHKQKNKGDSNRDK